MTNVPHPPRQIDPPDTEVVPASESEVVETHHAPAEEQTETVTEPAKVMRIGSMVKQLLEEVRTTTLDEASRERLAEIYERSIVELSEALSPDLQDELKMLALPFKDDAPSESELRVAKAQLVGWLEGLFHGIQATLFAQQLAARQQLEQMRQLPPGQGQMPGQMDPRMMQQPGQGPQGGPADRPGTYL
ncbi:MAG TPA: bacterial proteasome activator family protein [Ilumatobacteraceae bacterium]|nr:bacterial proteasome activator family protein [Ilumatobacteraceae bacterium]